MLSPIEIHNKEFPTKFKGYDPEEVNDYLDEIIRTMEQLIRDNKDLDKRVKFNEEEVAYFNSIQETLNKSIIVAQEAADRLKENARKDAEIIIFEAERTAEAMLKEAAEKATQINRETDALKKETRIFRQRLQIMVESQLEMIKNEEWDLLLNSHSKIEVTPPSIDSILAKRAQKNDQLLGKEEVRPKAPAYPGAPTAGPGAQPTAPTPVNGPTPTNGPVAQTGPVPTQGPGSGQAPSPIPPKPGDDVTPDFGKTKQIILPTDEVIVLGEA